jgi:hypothetical protein
LTAINFFSPYISGSQRLPNGNTLICEGCFGRPIDALRADECCIPRLSVQPSRDRRRPWQLILINGEESLAEKRLPNRRCKISGTSSDPPPSAAECPPDGLQKGIQAKGFEQKPERPVAYFW